MESARLQRLITRISQLVVSSRSFLSRCGGWHPGVDRTMPDARAGIFRSKLGGLILLSIFFLHLEAGPSFAQDGSPGARGVTATGFPENGVFEGSSFDSVQMNNGNLHLQIPFKCVPGRGQNHCYVYSYDNRGWYYHGTTLPSGGTIVNPRPEAGNSMQWRLPLNEMNYLVRRNIQNDVVCNESQGQPIYGAVFSNYVLFEPDGTQHGFYTGEIGPIGPQCNGHVSGRFYSTDGSGWVMDINDGMVIRAISKTGTQVIFQESTQAQVGIPVKIVDRNGNEITDSTDSAGRAVPRFTTDPITRDSTFAYTDSQGSARNIAVSYVSVPVHTQLCPFSTEFGCTNEYQSTWKQPQTIQLPNGLAYQFSYEQNQYGEPNSVTLPTGATITWTWGGLDQGGRKVTSRTVTSNGQSATWSYSWGTASFAGPWQNSMVDPAGNETVYTCQNIESGFSSEGDPSCSITRVRYYSGLATAGNLLKTVQTDYGGSSTPLPIRETVTLHDTNQVSKVETDWDTLVVGQPAAYFTWRNPTERREYDWGNGAPGSLIRRTHYNYLHLTNQAYQDQNLADLPTGVTVYDGGGNIVAQTQTFYDDSGSNPWGLPYMQADLGNATAHDSGFGPGYLLRGNATRVQSWLSTSNSWLTTYNGYDDLGNLVSTTDALGHSTRYNYSDRWANTGCVPAGVNTQAYVTEVSNALGQKSRTAYYPCTGLVQASQNQNDIDAGRNGVTFTYDLMDRPLTTSFPDGGQTSLDYHNDTLPLRVTKTTAIRPDMNLVSSTVADGLGRPIQTSVDSDPQGVDYVDIVYDKLGRKKSVSNPYRATSDPTYGITTYQYDALGRVTQVAPPDGTVPTDGNACQANNICTQYSGITTTVTDQAGRQRRSASDALGRLIEVDELGAGSASPGQGSVTISGSEKSKPGAPATPGSVTITISGSERSRIVRCLPDPCDPVWDTGTVSVTVNGFTEEYIYGEGSTTSSIASALAYAFNADSASPVIASANGATLILTSKATGAASNYPFTTSSATDNEQYFRLTSFPVSPVAGSLAGGLDAGPQVYDHGTCTVTVNGTPYSRNFGQGDDPSSIASGLTGVITAGNFVTATANGATISLTAKTGGEASNYSLSSSCSYDSSNFTSPSFAASPSGSALTGGADHTPYVTLYAYDTLGNLLRVDQKGSAPTDSAKWRTRTFTYDSLSRLVTANNPESGTLTYSYDAVGNLLQKTSPAPNQTGSATQTISYCYDELNRPTGRAYSAQTCANGRLPSGTAAVSYVYDAGANAKGKLTSLTDQAGTASYTYDIMGRMATEQRAIAGVSKTVSYEYNLDGSLKVLHYPSGAAVTYTPDSAGRVLSAVDVGNSINYVTSATYGPDGALTGFVSGNTVAFAGITNAFSYNNRLQPVSMSASSPSQTVFSIGYDFHVGNGDNGNVFAISNNRDSTRNQTFTYDALNRLASAQNTGTDCSVTVGGKTKFWGNAYGYDAWGNLLSKTITKCGGESLSVTAGSDNRLQGGYTYDAAGNMMHDATSGANYTYDQENRISGVAGHTYTYDADGNRVRKSNGSAGTLYWYMAPGIVAESDLTGAIQSEYVFFDGERVARRDGPNGAGSVFYYFSDHLKTASVITDSAGNIKAESDYYPWGGEIQFVNNDSNHYKFTGKERDLETSLDYFGARYYSNALGRFITPDWSATPAPVPYADLNDPQTLNQYGYARNMPTSKIDSDGHCPECPAYWLNSKIQQVDAKITQIKNDIVDYGKGLGKSAANAVIDTVNYGNVSLLDDGRLHYNYNRYEPSNEVQAMGMNAGDKLMILSIGLGKPTPVNVAMAEGEGAAVVAPKVPGYVVSPDGTAFPVPKGAQGPVPVVNEAGKTTGVAFTGGKGGANGQVDTIRIMDPTPPKGKSPGYPNGYVKYQNKAKQGVNPHTGRTAANKDNHFPIK
jgi:RHS repeat-associated protein